MARPKNPMPSLHRHKASGLAYVYWQSKQYWLSGYWPEGEECPIDLQRQYRRKAQELLAETASLGHAPSHQPTVSELATLYIAWADEHYRKHGRATAEAYKIRSALELATKQCGAKPCREIHLGHLEAVRAAMVSLGWGRDHVNRQVRRIVRAFAWGKNRGHVSHEVVSRLSSVEPLKRARTEAHEPGKVAPVAWETIQATLPHLVDPWPAIVMIQYLVGCRPGDVRLMRAADIDPTVQPWLWRPWTHKEEHMGKDLVYRIGPRAQELLAPRLGAANHAFISWTGRPYGRSAYRIAVHAACVRGNIAPWNPNQLRHARATEIRARYGREVAQMILGHSSPETTDIYAERDDTIANRAAMECG